MVQGVGLEYLSSVLAASSPSHVVMLQSKSPRKNLPCHAFWADAAAAESLTVKLLSIPGVGSQGLTLQAEGASLLGF